MSTSKPKTTGRAAPEANPDGAASPENAARMAERARMAYSSPIPAEDIQPLRETPPEAIVR